jgi:hypothetical protein
LNGAMVELRSPHDDQLAEDHPWQDARFRRSPTEASNFVGFWSPLNCVMSV